jgi:hypothetical protein
MVFDKATNTLSCQDAYSILNPNSIEIKILKNPKNYYSRNDNKNALRY